MRPSKIVRVVGVVVAALVASAVVAALGPESKVICGRGHFLDRLAQAVMEPLGAGHTDGPTATYCGVPSTSAWLNRHRRVRSDHGCRAGRCLAPAGWHGT
jgi:hypothetical protein